jgi:aspartate-semialdehyde dehydrogenase
MMAAPEVARFPRRAHIALFDATTLAAKGVKDQLVARAFPSASVRLYTSSTEPDSNLTEFGGEAMLVTQPDIEALGHLDIAFLCGDRREGGKYLDWAERGGFVGIDLTQASVGSPKAVPVNAAVNPEAIPEGPGIVHSPHPISLMLSTLLAPLQRRCGLEEAVAVVLRPASEFGTPGIDELYQQSLSLMNFQEMPKEIFGRQLAFNLLPECLVNEAKDASPPHRVIEREVQRITGSSHPLSVQTIQAPVFHGHVALLHLVLSRGKTQDHLLAALKGLEDVRLGQKGDKATPVERAGQAETIVTGLQPAAREGSFWLWAVSDDLAGGTSRNAVRIAEAILKRGLARGRA